MEEVAIWAKAAVGVLAGVCTAVWGGADGWLAALVAFMVLDYLTGVTAAWLEKQLSSEEGFHGLLKKMLILLIAALGSLLDGLLGANGALRSVIFGFYLANEGLSVLENAARCGVPVPASLRRALKQLSKEDEPDGDEQN